MRARLTNSTGKQVLGGGAIAALMLSAACGSAPHPGAVAPASPGQTAPPVVVSCAPTQRTIVHPTVVNGVAMSQVECVAPEAQPAAGVAAAVTYAPSAPPAAAPVVYRTAPVQRAAAPAEMPDTEVVPVATRTTAARPAPARQVIYEERQPARSVKKSAVIIGSAAGAGAGVGAAVGGKKGALIGAAIGGGGAAVWDQITRRKK
jgi:hypothetical protein